MFTLNIDGSYDVTGTNDAQAYCLSTDTKPTGEPLKNGYKCIEMDTSRIYFYDEEGEKWWQFGS